MIRINLLPYRSKKRVENIQRQVTIFLICFFIILASMLYYNLTLTKKIGQLNTQVANINAEIVKVEKQAQKVDALRKELQILNQKIDIIKDLETQRKGAVRLLDNMTQMVAEETTSSSSGALEGKAGDKIKRLWFTSFQAAGDDIKIKGIALDNKTVADFMTRLEVSKLFINVNLQRLQQQKIKNLNLKNFEISCSRASLKTAEKDKKNDEIKNKKLHG